MGRAIKAKESEVSKTAVTIGNIPIAKYVRKGTGKDRQNLVFGWGNAPFPAEELEVVAKFGAGPAAGSLEEELAEVEEAYSRDFPSSFDAGTWYRVIATFVDHVIARHEMFDPRPDSLTLFNIPYTGGPDAESIVFGTPEEVEVEFVAKEIAAQLVIPVAELLPKEDLQGDRIPMEELESAVYKFVRESGRADVGHGEVVHGQLVESFVVTDEKLTAMGVPEEVHDQITKGVWLGFLVDDETMDQVESGELTMFSIGGAAVRDPD